MSAPTTASLEGRGSHLLGEAGTALPYVARGHGVYLEDEHGCDYLDGSSGALAASLGHGRRDIAQVMQDQAASVAFAHRTQLRNRPTEELAALIAGWAPGDLDRCLFVSSGSDANEMALRLAIHYWNAKNQPGRTAVLARDRSYHGATLGALSLTGLRERRTTMEPRLIEIGRLPSPPPQLDPSGEDQLLRALEDAFAASEQLAAVIVEPMSGTSGGAIAPPPSYVTRLRQLCDASGALLIADEVMSGFGRTGRAFACDHVGLRPDILTFGKGVSGGYAPLAGVIARPEIAEAVADIGGVGLGHTYMNTPLTSAVGLAASRVVLDAAFLDAVETRGVELRRRLVALQHQHPDALTDVRGRGLMNAVEITNVDADHATGLHRLVASMREAGVLLYPGTPHSPEEERTHLLMVAPPLVVTTQDIDELVTRFRRGLELYSRRSPLEVAQAE